MRDPRAVQIVAVSTHPSTTGPTTNRMTPTSIGRMSSLRWDSLARPRLQVMASSLRKLAACGSKKSSSLMHRSHQRQQPRSPNRCSKPLHRTCCACSRVTQWVPDPLPPLKQPLLSLNRSISRRKRLTQWLPSSQLKSNYKNRKVKKKAKTTMMQFDVM